MSTCRRWRWKLGDILLSGEDWKARCGLHDGRVRLPLSEYQVDAIKHETVFEYA